MFYITVLRLVTQYFPLISKYGENYKNLLEFYSFTFFFL